MAVMMDRDPFEHRRDMTPRLAWTAALLVSLAIDYGLYRLVLLAFHALH